MRPTLKLTIALEEVILDVADHPFTFAFGPCSIGTAGFGRESIVVAQVQKAFVEAHHSPWRMLYHGRLLIVYQHLLCRAAQVLQAADDAFIGVFCVLAVGAPEVEASRVAQFVDDEGNLALLTVYHCGVCNGPTKLDRFQPRISESVSDSCRCFQLTSNSAGVR